MVRFLLLSLLILLALYLALFPHEHSGLRFVMGMTLLVVGLLGYVASLVAWLRSRG